MSSSGSEGHIDSISDSLPEHITAGQMNVIYFKTQLNELWRDNVFTDITLEVEGKQFNCHKIILAANSPYFNSLLTNGMAETTKKTIELKDVSSVAMEHILRFIYYDFKDNSDIGIRSTNLSAKQALETLKAVDMFQIENGMKDILADYLRLNIADDNCLEIVQTAEFIGQPKLAETANEHALLNFDNVWKTDGLLELGKNSLVSYLGDDRLVVTEEENIFYAVDRWMSKTKEREVHALELFECVRFCFIKSKVLSDEIYTHALTNQFPCLNNYIIGAFRHQTTPCYQHEEHYYRCKPRNCETSICASTIFGGDDISISVIRETLSKVQTFEMTCCAYLQSLGSYLLQDRVCLVGQNIYKYLRGGELYRNTYKQDDSNFKSKGWKKCRASNSRSGYLKSFTLTLCGDYIYLIGGEAANVTVSSQIDMYDWRKDVWQAPQGAITTLIHPVFGHLTVALKGSLYIIGGLTVDGSNSQFLQIYNTREGKISMGPKLPTSSLNADADNIAYYGIRGACCNEEIYCFWGKTISKYSPQTSQWTDLHDIVFLVLTAPTLLVRSSKILAFGGFTAPNVCNKKVFEFDPVSGTTKVLTSFEYSLLFGDLPRLVKDEHLIWL
ncbi:unnamed protein product [Owenia fusiformis]|uniref:BTB domain-containing protein n=1 Tax=Owenia fusiformis TaxID=6347 RepID=A0A8S4PID8_OWEFU|nr:unnamed protein product [Owenia fusiformis]